MNLPAADGWLLRVTTPLKTLLAALCAMYKSEEPMLLKVEFALNTSGKVAPIFAKARYPEPALVIVASALNVFPPQSSFPPPLLVAFTTALNVLLVKSILPEKIVIVAPMVLCVIVVTLAVPEATLNVPLFT